MTTPSIDDLNALDLRVGTVTSVRENEGARVAAYVLEIDFGPAGVRISSAQLTRHYDRDSLLGRRVVAALGLPPRRVNGVNSQVLVLGAVDGELGTLLLGVDREVPNGTPIA